MLNITRRPKVFLSFAGLDRTMATRLAQDLLALGVEAFVDTRDIALGHNVVLSINREMAESDYYLLLWSRNCIDRPWVEDEWAAAYAREINERRSFLFIVRLDGTPLPPLLAVRRYLDGYRDWASVARELVACWRGDLAVGTPVFPPPNVTSDVGPPATVVRVRNQDLGMTHIVGARSDHTGPELLETVRRVLALPDSVSRFDAVLEIRFDYTLLHNGRALRDEPLAAQGITDGVLLDLELRVLVSGPGGPIGERVYRSGNDTFPDVPQLTVRSAVEDAFAHLLP